MKKLFVLFFFISFSSFSQRNENYQGNFLFKLVRPNKVTSAYKWAKVTDVYVTPDEKFLVIRWLGKLCFYSFHHFPLDKNKYRNSNNEWIRHFYTIGISNSDKRGYELFYKKPENGNLTLNVSNFLHYNFEKDLSYLLRPISKYFVNHKRTKKEIIQNNRDDWESDIEFIVEKSNNIPPGFEKLKAIRSGYTFKSKTFGDIRLVYRNFSENIYFYKE